MFLLLLLLLLLFFKWDWQFSCIDGRNWIGPNLEIKREKWGNCDQKIGKVTEQQSSVVENLGSEIEGMWEKDVKWKAKEKEGGCKMIWLAIFASVSLEMCVMCSRDQWLSSGRQEEVVQFSLKSGSGPNCCHGLGSGQANCAGSCRGGPDFLGPIKALLNGANHE